MQNEGEGPHQRSPKMSGYEANSNSGLASETVHPAIARAEFCMETATLLAGFAFECYNQPSLTWEEAPDGTRTGMLSPAFLLEHYDGVLAIDAVKAQLFRPSGLLPMQPLDTYLVLQVSGGGQPVRCETARGTEPSWDSSRFLYVRGGDAILSMSIYYEVGIIQRIYRSGC